MTRGLLLALVLLAVPLMLVVRPALETQAEHEDARLLPEMERGPVFGPDAPRVLLRNVIKGRPIPVCSAEYPNATQEAIRRWNAALEIDAFVWRGALSNCGSTISDIDPEKDRPEDGIGSIVVKGEPNPCSTVLNLRGCAKVFARDNPDVVAYDDYWNTYYGKVEVSLRNGIYPDDIGPTDALTNGRCRTFPIDPTGTLTIACERLLATATHELGHTLALAHFYDFTDGDGSGYENSEHDTCPDDPDNRDTNDPEPIIAIMTSPSGSPCWPEVGVPQDADIKAFRGAYYPGPATEVKATREVDGGVTVSWKREDLHGQGLHADYAVSYLARRTTETCWYVIGSDFAPYNSGGLGVRYARAPDDKTFASTSPAAASVEPVVYAVAVYTRALPNSPADWPGAASAKVTLCNVTKDTVDSLTPPDLARDSSTDPLYPGAYGRLVSTEAVTLAPTRVTCASGIAVPNPRKNEGLVRDCEALLAAKDVLLGDGAGTLNWSVNLLLEEKEDLEGSGWDGVTVAGTPKRVTRLNLFGRSLTGVIPEQMGSLTKLQHLGLASNQLTGAIPGELGELGRLGYLSLHSNSLSGAIPAELGKLKSLQQLYLRSNSLSGAIPTELGNLGNLFLLDLRNNSLSDAIPTELGNLELSHLWLAGNSFSCVPPDLRSITTNDLASLNLPDCLPEVSIAAVTSSVEEGTAAAFTVTRRGSKAAALTVKVRVTDGEGAFLEGADPREETVTIAAGALSKRLELDTDDDETDEPDGSVTATVRANTAVYDIDPTAGAATVAVTDNDEPPSCLTGTAVVDPDENPGLVADCTALLAARDALIGTGENAGTLNWSADVPMERVTGVAGSGWDGVTVAGTPKRVTRLDLFRRSLTGVIPEQMGSLTKLQHLGLASNQLTGEIPAELGELGSLSYLSLHTNLLEEAIPAELGKLKSLEQLYLRSNSLNGAIPTELGNLGNLFLLDLRNNSLSGAIPTELGNLELSHLWLAGNSFSCVPPDLRSITTNDLASLNLPDCDVVAPELEGTPTFETSGNDGYAKEGDTITVSFETTEALAEKPDATIGGEKADVEQDEDEETEWTATYTVLAGVNVANAAFDLGEIEDTSGNTSDPEEIPTGIAIDTIAPTATVGEVETSGNEGYAKEHDTITVHFATSPDLAADPTATIGGEMAKVDPNDNEETEAKEWLATYTVLADVNVANAVFALNTLMDTAGNVTEPDAIDTNIEIDTIAPAISGDPEYSVTGDDGVAELNELITVPFVISEEVSKPTATIGGQTATVVPTTVGSKTHWTAKYTVNTTLVVDDALFDITGLRDLAGNTADPSALSTGIEIDSPQIRILTTYVSPAAGGRVTVAEEGGATGALDISGPTSHKYVDGTQVRAKPITNDDYRFEEWTAGVCGTDTNPQAGANDCLITMDADKSITAFFVSQCTLVVNDASGGKGLGSTTVDCGTTVTATADPDDDHRFGSWTGVEVCESQDDTCDLAVGTAGGPPLTLTLAPIFVQQCTVGVGDPDNGTITATGGGATGTHDSPWVGDCNTVVTITATADSGYCWSAWNDAAVGETDTCEEEKTRTITITADTAPKVYSATFKEAPQCELEVTSGGGGSASGGGTYDCNTTRSISATADDGYQFDEWTGDAVENSKAANTTIDLGDSDKSVEATFDKLCTVAGAPDPAAGGTVTGGATVVCGNSVTLTATANAGYCFTNWSDTIASGASEEEGATGQACNKTGTRVVLTSSGGAQNQNFIANFHVEPRCTLTVDAGTGGSASGGGTYDCNTTRSISATADDGYQFDEWTGDAVENSKAANTTIDLGDSDKSVEATFDKLCTVAGAPDPAAGGTVTGGATVVCGNSVTLTATANAGYCFTNWSDTIASGASEEEGATGQACNKTGTRVVLTSSGGAQNQNFIANFHVEPQCTLTVRANTGGEAEGSWTGACGTTRTIKVTSTLDGYRFSGWTGASVDDASAETTTVVVDADITVSANFVQQCTLSVSANPTAGGTVDPEEDTIDCGKVHRVVATANTGYCFDEWKSIFGSTAENGEGAEGESEDTGDMVDDGVSGQDTCRSTSTGTLQSRANNPARVFQAIFRKHEHTLTVTINSVSGGAGTLKEGTKTITAGSHTYKAGASVTLTAAGIFGANHQWGGDCSESGATATCTVEMDSNKSISVTFYGSGFGSEEDEEDDASTE